MELVDKEKSFLSLVKKIKTLDLDKNEKVLLNEYLRLGRIEMLYLTEENILDINAWGKKESPTVKRDIQSNIRLFKRSKNKHIKLFLMDYLKSRNVDIDFSREEYIDLG